MFLRDISSFVPPNTIDNISRAESFGKSASFIESKIGAYTLPRKAKTENAADLATQSVIKLLRKTSVSREEIDLLCVVTQNPAENGIPHTSALVHGLVDFPASCSAFDISLGCSGYIYGLSIVSGFLAANHLNHAILVTSDPYSDIIDDEDPNTSLLFGDAATASLISRHSIDISLRIGRLIGFSDGKSGNAIRKSESGKLVMNGRAVFNFALKQVPQQIHACLRSENLLPADIDIFALHQGSYAIIDAISRSFPGFEDRFLKDISKTGNTVSSSVPLLLENILDLPDYLPERIVISGFGIGLSAATMLLSRFNPPKL